MQRIYTVSACVSIVLAVGWAVTAKAASISINSTGTFTHQRELITDGISATVDSWYSTSADLFSNTLTNDSDATLVGEGSSSFGWITTTAHPGSGEVKWHFQTTGTLAMQNDFQVTYTGLVFDFPFPASGNRQATAAWSTDDSAYTTFNDDLFTPGSGTVGLGGTFALSGSGFTGGTDLYLRIQLIDSSNDFRNIQLFRDNEANNGAFQFVVTGTVVDSAAAGTPEPPTLALASLALLSLGIVARRRSRTRENP